VNSKYKATGTTWCDDDLNGRRFEWTLRQLGHHTEVYIGYPRGGSQSAAVYPVIAQLRVHEPRGLRGGLGDGRARGRRSAAPGGAPGGAPRRAPRRAGGEQRGGAVPHESRTRRRRRGSHGCRCRQATARYVITTRCWQVQADCAKVGWGGTSDDKQSRIAFTLICSSAAAQRRGGGVRRAAPACQR